MIISTKYLITGDGKTVLTDKAVYIGEDGSEKSHRKKSC